MRVPAPLMTYSIVSTDVTEVAASAEPIPPLDPPAPRPAKESRETRETREAERRVLEDFRAAFDRYDRFTSDVYHS